MTDVLLKPAFVSLATDSGDTTKLGPNAWNAARVFSAGSLGDLAFRDTGSTTGASWLPDVAVGSVLVSGGVAAAPAWSASPALSGSLSALGDVGVGTATPSWKFHVVGTNSTALGAVRRFGGVAQWIMERWAGTPAAPTAVTAASTSVGELGAYVLTDVAAGQQNCAYIRFYLDGPGTATSAPGDFQVFTTPIGTTVSLRRLKVSQDGRMALGNYAVWGAGAINEAVKLGPMGDGSPMHLALLQTTKPVVTSGGGTSPTVVGSDAAMTVTMGATGVPASPFVITFNAAWQAAPSTVVMMGKSGMVAGKKPLTVVTTTTTITVTTDGTAPDPGDVYHIHCFGVA